MAQPKANLELSKTLMESMISLTSRGKPVMDKINGIPKMEMIGKLRNITQIIQDEATLTQIADSRKRQKLIDVVNAILNVMDKEDADFNKFKDIYASLDVEKIVKAKKKRKTKQHDFIESDSFNSAAKVPKIFKSSKDMAIPANWIEWNSNLGEPVVFIEATDEKEVKKLIDLNKNDSKISAEITSLRTKDEKIIARLTNSLQAMNKFEVLAVKTLYGLATHEEFFSGVLRD